MNGTGTGIQRDGDDVAEHDQFDLHAGAELPPDHHARVSLAIRFACEAPKRLRATIRFGPPEWLVRYLPGSECLAESLRLYGRARTCTVVFPAELRNLVTGF